MNDDIFSRNEAWMAGQSFNAEHRYASRESEREDADRIAEQIELVQSIKSISPLVGVPSQEAIAAIAQLLTREERRDRIVDFYTLDDTIDIANAIREQNVREIDVIAALVRRNANNERAIESLQRELADLRALQQSADPTGAHPYRSIATRRPLPPMELPLPGPAVVFGAAKAPSRPAVTSDAPERVEGRPGVLRRVYGALRRIAAAGRALRVPVGTFVLAAALAPGQISLVERAIGSAVLATVVAAVVASERGT